jgi:glycine oxidase
MSDFLIIGGGVIGLLTARELANAGASVTLVEAGECCREASWAGGGIVSPLYPWRYSAPVTALASYAQQAYPALVAGLLSETGIDPQLERTGLLMFGAEDESEALQWSFNTGHKMERVSRDFIYSREPALAEGFGNALWMPEIANVRNPRLGQALLRSLKGHSQVCISEHTQVTGFDIDLDSHVGAKKIVSVQAQKGGVVKRLAASQVILTAGAWSGGLLTALGLQLALEPVKGQMLLFRPVKRLINSILLKDGRYLIPRRDNHLLVGSTLEYEGFDKSITQEASISLIESAVCMLPALRKLDPIMQWAGLRPAAPDGLPYIGQVADFDNLHINAGHYRNGLVLAPASAMLLADLLLGRRLAIDPEPYLPRLSKIA